MKKRRPARAKKAEKIPNRPRLLSKTGKIKHVYEGIAALAALIAIVAFITGRAKLTELIFDTKPTDVWHVASLANKTDHPMTFSVFRPDESAWGLVSIKPQSVRTFSAKNHTIDVMVNGEMIIYREPVERVTHTYDGLECYVLEGPTFTHKPSEAELRSAPPNQFSEMLGGHRLALSNGKVIYFGIVGPTSGGLKTFVPDGLPGKQLSTFEDPDTLIWTQPTPTEPPPK